MESSAVAPVFLRSIDACWAARVPTTVTVSIVSGAAAGGSAGEDAGTGADGDCSAFCAEARGAELSRRAARPAEDPPKLRRRDECRMCCLSPECKNCAFFLSCNEQRTNAVPLFVCRRRGNFFVSSVAVETATEIHLLAVTITYDRN